MFDVWFDGPLTMLSFQNGTRRNERDQIPTEKMKATQTPKY